MKTRTALKLFAAVVLLSGVVGYIHTVDRTARRVPSSAAGFWRVEVKTPPCDSHHNIQVIWPESTGLPVTIECDEMPVATR